MQYNARRESGSRAATDVAAVVVSTPVHVVIPYRSPELTRAALQYAASLANDLNVRLRLIDVHVVPYGVPLDEPTVIPKHLVRKIRNLGRASGLPVSPEIVYARDWAQGFRRSLSPGSIVLMAIKRSWWAPARNDSRRD